MTEPSTSEGTDGGNELHYRGVNLDDGDKVLFNDRSRPLTVDDRHKRANTSTARQYRGEADEYTVIELVGNGTEYHLLCLPGAEFGPMLYKEADWDEDKTNRAGQSPKYSRMGERVESMEVVNDG